MKCFPAMRAAAVAAAGLLASAALAQPSATFLTVEATSSLGTGTVTIPVPAPTVPGQQWDFGGGFAIMDGPTTIGTVGNVNLSVFLSPPGPRITMSFEGMTADAVTDWKITTTTLGTSLFNPDAVVSGGLTLTDTGLDGASLTGLNGNGDAFRALYNGGTELVSAVSGFSAGSGMSATSGPYGTFGLVPVAGAVNDMSLEYHFQMSATDSASGTVNYLMIPEPASIALLALGALALRRR